MSWVIKEWANNCENYLAKKRSPKFEQSLQTWNPSHPFWQLALDNMGPLPESEGFKNTILIGDHFSNWYEAVPMKNQEPQTVAKILGGYWIHFLAVQQICTAKKDQTSSHRRVAKKLTKPKNF